MNDLTKFINSYPTKNKQGFTPSELQDFYNLFEEEEIDRKKWDNSMFCNGALSINGEIVTFHEDVYWALIEGIAVYTSTGVVGTALAGKTFTSIAELLTSRFREKQIANIIK